MLKITSGLSEKHLKFNFSTYLDQLRELKEIKGAQNLMYSTHPNFLNRMQALIWFSMSIEYNEHFNTGKKGTFDLKNVDDKIYESIKKVIGDEVEYSNREVVSRALMWGSIDIFLSDKTVVIFLIILDPTTTKYSLVFVFIFILMIFIKFNYFLHNLIFI